MKKIVVLAMASLALAGCSSSHDGEHASSSPSSSSSDLYLTSDRGIIQMRSDNVSTVSVTWDDDNTRETITRDQMAFTKDGHIALPVIKSPGKHHVDVVAAVAGKARRGAIDVIVPTQDATQSVIPVQYGSPPSVQALGGAWPFCLTSVRCEVDVVTSQAERGKLTFTVNKSPIGSITTGVTDTKKKLTFTAPKEGGVVNVSFSNGHAWSGSFPLVVATDEDAD